MKNILLNCFVTGLAVLLPHAKAGDIVINEIMYHPAPAVPDDPAREWIELHNKGTNTIVLTGWRFEKGVNFLFPACTIGPLAYLVVAANTNAFLGEHPGFSAARVVGNWTGKLRNSGEEIQLVDEQGQPVNAVEYSNEGNWALRRSGEAYPGHPEWWRGWQWTTTADGGGNSLELRNPDMPNQYGQNWAASQLSGGTPGEPNSVATNKLAPMILEARHLPLIPKSTNAVTISVRIMDEETNPAVTLQYRVDGTTSFTAVTMFDDGQHGDGLASDGVYGAILPARADKTIVEYYISAADMNGNRRTWPGPTDDYGTQGANALYQVDDSTYAGSQSVYRAVVRASEWTAWLNLMDNVSSGRYSDAAMNATVILSDGRGAEVRYNCDVRNRGAGTRAAHPHNFNMSFPADRPLHGFTRLDFNTRTVHSQVAGKAVITAAGLPNAYGAPVQVRVNGRNLANASPTGGADSFQFGSYYCFEPYNSEWAGVHFPNDLGGNIYKGVWYFDGYGLNTPANLEYLGTNPASYKLAYTPSGPTSYTGPYSKQSNSAEDDWSDLIQLTYAANNLTGEDYLENLNRVANVEEWLNYCAVNTLLLNMETTLATGAGDDYFMYRGELDPRFVVLCHDLDTSLAQGDATPNYSKSIFDAAIGGGNRPGIHAFDLMLKHPAIAPRYYAILKELADTTFSPAQINPLFDQVLGGWVPDSYIQSMKNAARDRRTNVLWQIPLSLSMTSSIAFSQGYLCTTNSTVTLFGWANAIETRSVRVNGSSANWSAWEARWTSTITLVPGINRVLVQAMNTNGVEFDRNRVDVWYDNGAATMINNPITVDSVWTQSGGPYVVNTTMNVSAKLTIEAGTTVFFLGGASLNVTGAGRLLAEGTEMRHIRFARLPGGGYWGSLVFQNATNESRLGFAEIEGCNGTSLNGHTAKVHVNNGRVFFDHLSFANTPAVQYISFDSSSFVIQNCTFPSYPYAASAPELIHGVNGIPAGGYGIFRDNYFGHTWGYNDTIDFTDGNRLGAILQCIGNVFDGASDDQLDLDSTAAWIEGNTFMHAHRDTNSTAPPLDTASAISGGVDFAGVYAQWTIINNLFYDMDHACLNKGGGRFIFIDNTLVHVAKENGAGLQSDIAAFAFTDNNVSLPDPSLGAGAYVADNIIWDCPRLVANYSTSNDTVIFENNLLPMEWNGLGSNNVVADPRLTLSLITNTLLADWKTVQAALNPLPSSPALGTGIGKFDKGGLNPKGLLVFGEPEDATRSTSAQLQVAPGESFLWGDADAYVWGYTHYKWKLDNAPWSDELALTTSPFIYLTNLSNGPHTVYVTGKNDAGFYQDDVFIYPLTTSIPAHVSRSRTWTVSTNSSRLMINEVLASNRSAVEHEGSYPDLVELYNDSTSPADLSGMGLTDKPLEPYKFIFPIGTTIAAGEFLVLYADNHQGASGLHLGFALDANGGGMWFYGSNTNVIDSVVYGPQIPDLSIGREPNGDWTLTDPTFGSPNKPHALRSPLALKINEWLANAGVLFPDDFVELYNPDPAPVSLGGLFLSDLPQSYPGQFEIAPLSFIGGQACLAFIADGLSYAERNHLNFKLSPDWGEIGLFTHELQRIDSIFYGPQATDISQGRTPSGSSVLTSFTQPTPGAANFGFGNSMSIGYELINLVPFTNTWRFNWAGVDLGTTWSATNYDDSSPSWNTGPAMVYYTSDTPGSFEVSVQTWIPIPGLPIPNTIYFRTHFNLTNNPNGFSLYTAHIIDDGAVYYLNGQEIYRYNMPNPPDPMVYSTRSLQNIGGNPRIQGYYTLPCSNLIQGDNVLAVEVHQSSSSSSDVGFALTLDLFRNVTNYATVSVLLNEVMANNDSITNADGTITDWIELYNPSTNSTDLSDMSLSDDSANPRRWVFPANSVISANSFLLIRCDGSTSASTNSLGLLNTGFGLKANGDKIYLFDKPARGGAPLDSISFGIQASDFSLGRVPDAMGGWKLCLPTPGSQNIASGMADLSSVRINEWLAEAGTDPDWFELYNPNNQPVDLSGCYLTDDLNNWVQYSPLPPYSFIAPGGKGFAVFYADKKPELGPDHLNFKLDKDGEAIGLFSPSQNLIDGVTFAGQQQDVSQGRLPDGTTNVVRFPYSASRGAANFLPLTQVVINEALTYPVLPLQQAIELRNASAESVNIGGWWLSNARDDLKRFQIPEGTVLAAGGYMVFYQSQFNPPPWHLPSFALNSTRDDELYLSQTDTAGNLTGYRAVVTFGPAQGGFSFGRYETSQGADFVLMSQRSFGEDNPSSSNQFLLGTGLPNAYPMVGPIVISEIQYHPPDNSTNDNVLDEFIELVNVSTNPVPLYDSNSPAHTWHLRNAVDFDFPTNLVLQPQEYLLVVSFDPQVRTNEIAQFRSKYGLGANVRVYGPYAGKLANDKDNLELRKPGDPDSTGDAPYILVERIKYSDSAPWPSAGDGNTNNGALGLSLQRRILSAYANEPTNWVAGSPTPGADNGGAFRAAVSIASQPSDQSVLPGTNISFTVAAAGTGPLNYQWFFEGTAIPGATNSVLMRINVQAGQVGHYTVRVSNPYGADWSRAAMLEVRMAPEITSQPQGRVVILGGATTLSVTARGTAPIYYKWRKNGQDMANTNAMLTLTNLQFADAGEFTVVLTNNFGVVTSQVAIVAVNVPPIIEAQPQDQVALTGSSVSFAIQVTGSEPLRYQWRRNGLNLLDQTNSTLIFTNVQLSQAGLYSVMINNNVAWAASANAALTIIVPPAISVHATVPRTAENGTVPGIFTLRRTGATNLPISVNFTIAGTAGNGTDYQLISSPVTLPAGVSSAEVAVRPINDSLVESPEAVLLTLATGEGYTMGTPNSAAITIIDDENHPPMVSVNTPHNEAFFPVSPTNILISATATDPDGSMSRVDFYYQGTNLLGSAGSAPFQIVWTNVPPGTNHLIAVATDDLGADAVSEEVVFVINHAPVVTMVSPTNETRFAAPANILIQATASDPDGIVTNLSFYSGGNWIGTTRGGPNFAMIWSNVPPSTNLLMAVATDNWGLSATSSMARVYVGTLRTNFADNFMYRGFLNGYDHFLMTDSANAMSDPGEPAPCAGTGRRTMWITWTAPVTGRCYLETWGQFDTVLSVYTNDPPSIETITNLNVVGCNDDVGSSTGSTLSFLALAGTAYHIRIAGFGVAEGGPFAFNLHLDPPGALLPPPGNLNVISVSGSQLALSWESSSANVDGYNIERSLDGTNFVAVASAWSSSTVYLDARLAVNTTYFYRVRAYDAYGPSSYTAIRTGFTAASSLGRFAVRINFASTNSSVPPQWEADDGAVFEDRDNGYSYGWDQDNSANSRLAGSGRSPYDSYILMQEGGEDRVWEIAVPANGYYIVHAVAGSAADYDGYYRLTLEGMPAIDGPPSAEHSFLECTNIVLVADGRLTVNCAPGAVGNRLAFLEITAAIPAYFVNEPANRTCALGSFTTFHVLADGTPPLNYQWRKNGTEILAATNAIYGLTNLQSSDGGVYSVVVYSPCGSITSAPIALNVVALGPDFYDDFEPGIHGEQWSEFSGAVSGPSSAGSTSGTNALLFGGQALRYAMTRPLNTAAGGLVDFQLRLSTGVLLPEEGVVLEFSTDLGNTWSTLRRYASSSYTNWTRIRESIPTSARTPSTVLRWRQTPSEDNCCGTWALDDVLVLVSTNLPPVIAWGPENQITPLKSNASFRVAAVGTWPFNYQWRYNGSDLIGQTNETLLVTNTTCYSQGGYSVVVCNPFGCATSSVAQLTADLGTTTVPILFFDLTNSWRYNQTENLTGTGWYGINYDDSGWPAGAGLLAYEDRDRLTGLIRTYLVDPRTPAPNLSTPRLYYFRSSFVLSNDIPIVALAAIIYMDDGGVIYLNGQPVNPPVRMLSLTPGYNDLTTSRPPIADGDAIEELVYLPFNALKAGTNTIAAEVHQESSSSTDITWGMAVYGIHLESNIFPVITSQPVSQSVDPGSTVNFSVTTTGYPIPSYQWRLNGNALSGRTSSILALTNVGLASAGNYTVLVSNITGVVTSSVAILNVRVPPTIGIHPQSKTGYAGTNVTLLGIGTGSTPLYYEWFQNGVLLTGRTNTSLTLTNIRSSMSGDYVLRVTNLYGSATSRVATVTVWDPAINSTSMHYSNGVFALPFTGCTLGSFTFECSSNLVNWTTLGTTNRPVQPLIYRDVTATNRLRFYRLRWDP